ncbi:MAG: Rpn family recombination-promoting nuclease/putative transposase, partial [Blastocatellia bacterium]
NLVVKCKFRGRRSCFLIHIEPESSRREKRGEFGRRMLRYLGLLAADQRLPVYPIAILSYDTPRDPESDTFRIEFPDKVVLVFHFTVIQLNRLKWRDFLRHDNPVASALMAKMGFAESERVEVKLECLKMIARLRLDRDRAGLLADFVDTYLKLSEEENKTLQAKIEGLPDSEREVTMEFTNSWYREGWQKGVQEGVQEGVQRERNLILRQLELQIGALSKRAQASIKRLSIEQLELLGETLIKFANPRDLTRWLRDHAPANGKPNGHPAQTNGRKTKSRTSA